MRIPSPGRPQPGPLLAVLFALLAAACGTNEPEPFAPLMTALKRGQPLADLELVAPRTEWQRLRAFYKAHKYRQVWTDGKKLRSSFHEILSQLENADRDALEAEPYDIDWLREQRERLSGLLSRAALQDDDEVVRLELRTSAAVLRWARHLSAGRFNPSRPGLWRTPERDQQPEEVVVRAIADGRLRDLASRLRPPHGEYEMLLAARRRYAELAQADGWPAVPGTRRVREGQQDAAVPALRARLAADGDLASRHANETRVLDGAVADALRRFQERHGLRPTGSLDRDTRTALNVPLSSRLRQIDVNIERWRFAPRDLGRRHIRVNIPDYYLALVEDSQVALGMRVILGTRARPTPVLTDEMRHIVFSPYWNIPESIANDEIVPALLSDPDYLRRNDIEVVRVEDGRAEVVDASTVDWVFGAEERLRLRQRPGARNALGHVKFVLSNHLNIYLHDTPAEGLFSRVSRALSHGCVRVERPVMLARALLNGGGWDDERIQAAMNQPEEQWVRLDEPVAVHLMYFTAWVGEDGRARFRADVYGHDAAQARALDASIRRAARRSAS